MQVIQPPDLPAPKGHYSPGIVHGGLLYLSGQLPIDPHTGATPAGIQEQTRLTLQNAERILLAAGITRQEVIQTRVFIADVSLWDAVNEEYRQFFGDHKPARSIIPVPALHFGCLLELEVLAAARSNQP